MCPLQNFTIRYCTLFLIMPSYNNGIASALHIDRIFIKYGILFDSAKMEQNFMYDKS